MSSPSGRDARKKRSRTACVPCRQAKVKCGMDAIPCARCQKLGIECDWNPQYKRARKSDRVSLLEKQIQELRGQYSQKPDGSAAALLHTAPRTPSLQSTPGGQDYSPISHRSTSHQHVGPYYAVRDIRLSQVDVAAPFSNFFEKYHPHVPFLEPTRTLDEYHESCELLFWTILSVGSREIQPEAHFLKRLAPYLRDSTNSILHESAPRNPHLGHVQALLLMALWPPHDVSYWGDRCMSLANLALTLATSIGLQSPGFEQEYYNSSVNFSDRDRAERMRTWAACVACAQNLAMDFGLPTPLPFENWSIRKLCDGAGEASTNTADYPVDLLHLYEIQRLGYKCFGLLPERASNEWSDDNVVAALEKSEAELQVFQSKTALSLLNRLRLTSLMLHIRSMHFQRETSKVSRKAGILSAQNAATSLLTIAIQEDGCNEIMCYSPRTTLRMLFHAACVVWRVLHSSYRSELDYDSGKILSSAVQLCLRQQGVQSEDRKDLPHRMANMLRGLWHLVENDPAMQMEEPELVVHTRLGASVAYHCLATFFGRLENFRRRNPPGKDNAGALDPGTGPLPDILSDFQKTAAEFGLENFDLNMLWQDDFPYADMYNGF